MERKVNSEIGDVIEITEATPLVNHKKKYAHSVEWHAPPFAPAFPLLFRPFSGSHRIIFCYYNVSMDYFVDSSLIVPWNILSIFRRVPQVPLFLFPPGFGLFIIFLVGNSPNKELIRIGIM